MELQTASQSGGDHERQLQSAEASRKELERQLQSAEASVNDLQRQVHEGERRRDELQVAAQQGKAADVQLKALQTRLAQATQAAETAAQDLTQARSQVQCFPALCALFRLMLQQLHHAAQGCEWLVLVCWSPTYPFPPARPNFVVLVFVVEHVYYSYIVSNLA